MFMTVYQENKIISNIKTISNKAIDQLMVLYAYGGTRETRKRKATGIAL